MGLDLRFLPVALAVALAVTTGVAACGDDGTPAAGDLAAGDPAAAPGVEDPAAVPARDLDPAPPAPVADPEVGDRVPVGTAGGSVAVLAVEADVNAGRLFAAGPGRSYYAVEVEGCSGRDEEGLSFEAAWFLLRSDDARAFDPGLPVKRPEMAGGEVPAGECISGWITYTVPDDATPSAVLYDGSSRITWRIPPEDLS